MRFEEPWSSYLTPKNAVYVFWDTDPTRLLAPENVADSPHRMRVGSNGLNVLEVRPDGCPKPRADDINPHRCPPFAFTSSLVAALPHTTPTHQQTINLEI